MGIDSETAEQRDDWCLGFDDGQAGVLVSVSVSALVLSEREPSAHYLMGYREGAAHRREVEERAEW